MNVYSINIEHFMTEEQQRVFDDLVKMHLVWKEIFKTDGKTFSTLAEVQEHAFGIGASSFYVARTFRRARRDKIRKCFVRINVHFIELVFENKIHLKSKGTMVTRPGERHTPLQSKDFYQGPQL